MTMMPQQGNLLWHAARAGDLAHCRELIAAGVDINVMEGGYTPLHHAVDTGRIDVCRLLLESGADIHYLGERLKDSVLLVAMQSPAMRTDMLELLLAHGAAPCYQRPHDQRTALHQAAMAHRSIGPEVIRLLVEHGADWSMTAFGGETALHYAAWNDGFLDNARVLVHGGADPAYVPDGAKSDYLTPFQTAVREGQRRLMEYFVYECGQDLDQKTLDGRTLLELVENRRAPSTALGVFLSVATDSAIRCALPPNHELAALSRRISMGPSL